MELIRVAGNILIGIAVVIIAFTSHKNPSEAFRFLYNCIFESSGKQKELPPDRYRDHKPGK